MSHEMDAVLDEMLNAPRASRDALLFTVRLLEIPGILPEGSGDAHQFQRRFVSLFEQAVPDIAQLLKLKELKQTIDKVNTLRGLQTRVSHLLEPLTHTPANPIAFAASKQSAFQILNNQLLKAYLHPYDFAARAMFIREIYNEIAELLACKDATFVLKLEACERKLNEADATSGADRDLFSIKGFRPFLASARTVLAYIRDESAERFRCVIRPKRPGS